MNVTCDKCRDADPECKFCHGHPYVNCRDAECVLWMREGYQEWKTGAQVLHEAMKKQPNLTEWMRMASPMMSHEELLAKAEERYTGGGVGPWQKTEMLDQKDLVFCDNMAQFIANQTGLAPDIVTLGQCVGRLVKEIRDARSWPTPSSHKPNFKYVKADDGKRDS